MAVRLLPLAAALAAAASAQEPVRVACLGDSITYGARVVTRVHNCYPSQLGARLGPGFEVQNFGVGGATLLRLGDQPYVDREAFREALAWEPDVAVVILGTNDTCDDETRPNWQHREHLAADARALVAELAGVGARVLLCRPPRIFFEASGLHPDHFADLEERAPRLERIGVALCTVAEETEGVEYVDLSRVLRLEHVIDGVHHTPFGAGAIADRIAEAIATPAAPPLDVPGLLAREGIAPATDRFEGFRRWSFDVASTCHLVAPHVAAPGYPWIWRAHASGGDAALDLALLDRGFHVAYCDVDGLFGSPPALARWDSFHALCRRLGLGPRAVLEGPGPGALAALNWAAAHPSAVAAVVGADPVCDFRSWPGGRGGERSDEDWRRCLDAYGLTADEAERYAGMPLDRLAPLARAGVPLLVVLGTAGALVTPGENGELLAARYRELGGSAEVWRDPAEEPLLRAVLRAAGMGTNPATRAVPSAEYRSAAAGWGRDTWWRQLEALRELAAQAGDVELAFLGDSITQGLTGARERRSVPDGQRPFDRLLGGRSAVCLGLAGDRTEHLLHRIEHGALARFDPSVVVVQVGVDNVAAGHTARETAEGIAAVVHALLAREPGARVILCGPFPAGATADDPTRATLDAVHGRIAPLGELERVEYLDLRPLFLDAEGRLTERTAPDGVHLTAAGQEAWLEALGPLLEELSPR